MITFTGFRCPDCGQAHKMHADGYDFTMNKEMTKVFIDDIDPEGERYVRGEQDVRCEECGDTRPITEWIQAFKEPLMFFEMEQLCHCGGELWMDQIPGTKSYGFVCDKCEWVKPKQTVSGA